MPGQLAPSGGLQGLWAVFHGLSQRISSLEVWQRSGAIPAGTITQWGGTGVPGGALQCTGATFDPTQYPALAQALGSTTLPTITTTPITVIWTGPKAF